MSFRVFTVTGATPHELGVSHGTQLRPLIHKTYNFYSTWWLILGISDGMLRQYGADFQALLENYAGGKYAAEIAGIAQGSELPLYQIHCLNARTEIVNKQTFNRGHEGPNECTTLSVPQCDILAETWDWAEEAGSYTQVMKLERPDNQTSDIAMIVEPGIIAKIGVNAAGVGVALNLLAPSRGPADGESFVGVPVHVLLRVILDAPDLPAAIAAVTDAPKGWATTSVLHVAACGRSAVIELTGGGCIVAYSDAVVLLRTNHFVVGVSEEDWKGSPSSLSRYARAREIIKGWPGDARGAVTMTTVRSLLDDRFGSLPILREFKPDVKLGMNAGTITRIHLDLKEKVMYYTPGSPVDFPEYNSLSAV